MNKINLFFILKAGLFTFFACTSPQQPEQSKFELLDDSTMIRILIDLHTLDAITPYLFSQPNNDTAKAAFKALRNELLAKYHTDSTQFYRTYNYYMEHALSHMNQIYSAVVDSLNLRANTQRFDLWDLKQNTTQESKPRPVFKEPKKADSLLKKKIEKIRKKAASRLEATTTQ
jgi:hypothetical protein